MTPVIIGLLSTGFVLILGSFIFGGSFSAKPGKNTMTENQIEQLVERRFNEVKYRLDDEAEKSADYIKDQTERELEKLSNEKIMAVNEYSDQVMDQINKNHNEVMFLYSMLNDKQKELDSAVENLNRMKRQTEQEEKLRENRKKQKEMGRAEKSAESVEQLVEELEQLELDFGEPEHVAEKQISHKMKRQAAKKTEQENEPEKYANKEEIMKLHQEGMSSQEIARQLHLGIGEVRLVLKLSKER